jgi:hypothetical protein
MRRGGGAVRTVAAVTLAVGLALLAGCSGRGPSLPVERDGPGSAIDFSAIPDAVPRAEPLSRYGNPASYEVFGQRYHTMQAPDLQPVFDMWTARACRLLVRHQVQHRGRRTSSRRALRHVCHDGGPQAAAGAAHLRGSHQPEERAQGHASVEIADQVSAQMYQAGIPSPLVVID